MSKHKFYAVMGDDDIPRACHFIPGHEPEGAVEITAEQAAAISADLRAKTVVNEVPVVPQNFVTREEAQRMADEAAAKAVAAFAAEIVKPTGG